MKKNAKIYIAGHRGLVGSAITRKLTEEGYDNLLFKTHDELVNITSIEALESMLGAEDDPDDDSDDDSDDGSDESSGEDSDDE